MTFRFEFSEINSASCFPTINSSFKIKLMKQKSLNFSLKTRHIFKSCNIYLKPERFRKSKFTLSKVKLE